MKMLAALRTLFDRYREAWQRAWKLRRRLDGPLRTSDELQFLPSALSLRDTPVHPFPRILLWSILFILTAALAWSFVGQLDIVASARGKVVPSGRSKAVQASELSVIKQILVKDGQHVERGQLLIEFDSRIASADVAGFEAQLRAKQADQAIASAILNAIDNGLTSVALGELASSLPAEDRRLTNIRLQGRWAQVQTSLMEKEAELAQLGTQLAAADAARKSLEEIVPIARKVAADLKALSEKDFISQHQYLSKEQDRLLQERELVARTYDVAELKSQQETAKRQQERLESSLRQEMLELLAQSTEAIATFHQELNKARRREMLTKIEAPVSGTVQQLAVHTEGGVVQPAATLMVIVPENEPIEIEAMLPNKDAGFVHKDQNVEVKVDTFEFGKYGLVHGKISSISSDAIEMEGVGPVYAMRVQVEDVPDDITLNAGMSVTAEVKIGERRIIDYFLSPLKLYVHDSFRER